MAELALRQVCLYLPSLSGLAHFVRLEPTDRLSTAGVFESGRLVFNPRFFAGLSLRESTFVMAHELMHLALLTHSRGMGRRKQLVNIAHDYVINDLLRMDLGIEPPAGGLVLDGARDRSLEELVAWLEREPNPSRQRWRTGAEASHSAIGEALARAGIRQPAPRDPLENDDDWDDVLDVSIERKWFPGARIDELARRAETVRQLAADATARHRAWSAVSGQSTESEQLDVEVLKAVYHTPWQQALQRWMEFHAPGNRSYSRPSRRGAERSDVVLAGRQREGWTLHIVLDTSGSMVDSLPPILGALAWFAASVGVSLVHVVQCDAEVTKDEWIELESLDRLRVTGLGGSDLSPAMEALARDPEVEAVLVLTDGYIEYPQESPPYDVVWVLTEANDYFEPEYGDRVDAGV
jgi:predicted metal-dependent peptidase